LHVKDINLVSEIEFSTPCSSLGYNFQFQKKTHFTLLLYTHVISGADFTPEEEVLRQKMCEREIRSENTRLPSQLHKNTTAPSTPCGNQLQRPEKFSYLVTPSPAPGCTVAYCRSLELF